MVDEWTWITRAGVAAAFVLSIGSTAKLWWDAHRASRDRAQHARVEGELARIVAWLREQPPHSVISWNYTNARDLAPYELGVKQGVLKLALCDGQLAIRLVTKEDVRAQGKHWGARELLKPQP